MSPYLKAILKDPTLLIVDLIDNIKIFMFKTGIYAKIYRFTTNFIRIKMILRMARQGYETEEIIEILERFDRIQNRKLRAETRKLNRDNTEWIATLSREHGIPEHEIRAIIESKLGPRPDIDNDLE